MVLLTRLKKKGRRCRLQKPPALTSSMGKIIRLSYSLMTHSKLKLQELINKHCLLR